MNCDDVAILLACEDDLDQDKRQEIERHISCCQQCAVFETDVKRIRGHCQKIVVPIPSDEFFENTRFLCHAKLQRSSIPKYIWIALGALLILTGILMLPLAMEIMADRPLSFPAIGLLFLLLQNLLMLFFAPVLIKKIRFQKKDLINGLINKEVCHG